MRLLNIHNQGRELYLFTRDADGNRLIKRDNSFYPFYYEPDQHGKFVGYDGIKLKKIVCGNPKEIAKNRTEQSYSSDIVYTTNYIINRVDKIEPAPYRYCFYDIEILAKSLPEVDKPKFPVSAITVYDSFDKAYTTWSMLDVKGTTKEKEKYILSNFIKYLRAKQPDILLGWNGIDFDYRYLFHRVKNFAKLISPIGQLRSSRDFDENKEPYFFPAGLSICDYLQMFKKVYQRERSYALDAIAQKHLDDKEWGKTKFGEINERVVAKNHNDVLRMVKLEEKYHILDYFNQIRIYSKCQWEDLLYNSKIIDCLVLTEAKRRGVVLPKKQKGLEKEELIGAYRRAEPGLYNNLQKADLGSAYPNALINFCLDPVNISDSEGLNVGGYYFKQNEGAILPYLAKRLIAMKNELKDELKELNPNSQEYKDLLTKYNAIKGLVNSLYGVTALRGFRLYDNRVASTITFLVRDLLKYVEEKFNSKVRYIDTDSFMYESETDKTDELNQLIQEWGLVNYSKESIDIDFESEGMFTSILILGKTHYYGNVKTDKGIKKEIKGIEAKRSSSSKYEAVFQTELIEKVLEGSTREEIKSWIRKEKARIKSLPLTEVGFPFKLTNKKYKNVPIFIRAHANTNRFKPLNLDVGEVGYYSYINPMGRDDNNKPINVLAYSDDNDDLVKPRVNWNELIRRNIKGKYEKIFEALKWETGDMTYYNLV